MKSIFLVFCLMFSLISSNSWAQEIVIGTVDIQKVLLTIQEGQKIRKQLEKSFKDKQKILKDEEDKIRKGQEAYEKQEKLMNEQARRAKEDEIRGQIMNLQNKTAEFQKQIQENEAELKKPILDKLNEIMKEVSKESKVTLTMEASTSPIIYAQSVKDLTDDVIKTYDQKYPSKK